MFADIELNWKNVIKEEIAHGIIFYHFFLPHALTLSLALSQWDWAQHTGVVFSQGKQIEREIVLSLVLCSN